MSYRCSCASAKINALIVTHMHDMTYKKKNIVAPNFIGHGIHYSLVCTCAVSKMTMKTGPAKTGPAGLLAIAIQR